MPKMLGRSEAASFKLRRYYCRFPRNSPAQKRLTNKANRAAERREWLAQAETTTTWASPAASLPCGRPRRSA